jgi:hypothetical protein
MSRLIKALKSTGRRRFALRAVASCRLKASSFFELSSRVASRHLPQWDKPLSQLNLILFLLLAHQSTLLRTARNLAERSIHYGDNNHPASNYCGCSPVPFQPACAGGRYVVIPAFAQPLDRNREVVSINFCPLDISRRASSARAPISSFSHS